MWDAGINEMEIILEWEGWGLCGHRSWWHGDKEELSTALCCEKLSLSYHAVRQQPDEVFAFRKGKGPCAGHCCGPVLRSVRNGKDLYLCRYFSKVPVAQRKNRACLQASSLKSYFRSNLLHYNLKKWRELIDLIQSHFCLYFNHKEKSPGNWTEKWNGRFSVPFPISWTDISLPDSEHSLLLFCKYIYILQSTPVWSPHNTVSSANKALPLGSWIAWCPTLASSCNFIVVWLL